MANWIGRQIGKYEITGLLGRGGMGEVYKAYHPALERDVAIKLIHTHLASEPGAVERFRREAKVVAALRHPGIVQIYDFDVEGEAFYMVMEFVPGQSLKERLARLHDQGERLPLDEVLLLFHHITTAVAYAHQQGVVHRDLKPANVLLTAADQPILADFGLSRMISSERLTAAGDVFGTPQYMSPEQGRGQDSDTRTDVYALGIMLYELTTGILPFSGDTPVGVILKQINEPPAPPRSINPKLPEAVEQVIQRALAKEPSARYAAAQDLLQAIEVLITPPANDQTVLSPLDDGRCPYRGLQTFEAEHAEFFFGREALIHQLVGRLTRLDQPDQSRFLAVLGASGSGKSSVVRAGLIPALQSGATAGSETWSIAMFKPGSRPLEELAAQLGPRLYGENEQLTATRQLLDNLTTDGRALHLAVRLAWRESPSERRLLLVIDQFEEIFTLCRDETERQRLIENLLYAASSQGQIIVLLTMRADFYHRCAAYRELAGQISRQQVLVGPMNEAELRRAIARPAQTVGLRFEAGLVDTILADVVQQPGALPLLQHALLELWERRQRGLLTLQAYRDSGGVAGAITQRAETLYAAFSAEEQAMVRRIMLRLTQPGRGTEDTRRRARMSEFDAETSQIAGVSADKNSVIATVIQRLTATRLLTIAHDTTGGEKIIDVAHEALIRGWDRLRKWIDENRTALHIHRRLTEAVEEWEKRGRDAGYLYRDGRLTESLTWASRYRDLLSLSERQFLQTSALYDAVPESLTWDEQLSPDHRITITREAFQTKTLSVTARRQAVLSLSHWNTIQHGGELQQQILAILGDVARNDTTPEIRRLALEKVWQLGGIEAVSDWWTHRRGNDASEEISLLAELWDKGARMIPAEPQFRWRLLGQILRNRWRQRRGYLVQFVLYGIVGSAVVSFIASSYFALGLVGVGSDVAGTVLVGTITGFGVSLGLLAAELFEGWVRAVVRIVGTTLMTFILINGLLTSITIMFQLRWTWFWPPASATIVATLFSFALGLGVSLGEFWPKRPGFGYTVCGCLAVILVHVFILPANLALISHLGVALGTGMAHLTRARQNE